MNELIELGNALSQDFVDNKIDLTEGLKKVAMLKSLNQQQLRRVAETANVETYLKLANKAEDGYVQFPVADVNKAIEELDLDLKKQASGAFTNLWEDIKRKHTNIEIFEVGVEKTAEYNPEMSFAEIARKASEIKQEISDTREAEIDVVDNYKNTREIMKQAMVTGYYFNDLSEIVKEATGDSADALINLLKNDLEEEFKTADFEKKASSNKEINKTSSLYRSINKLETSVDIINERYEDLIKKANHLITLSGNINHRYMIKEALLGLKKLPLKRTAKFLAITSLLPAGAYLQRKQDEYAEQKGIK